MIKLMIADDHKPTLTNYQDRFEKYYELFAVSEAGLGLDAIKAGTFMPHVILSDYDFGIGCMTGVQFCIELRRLGYKIPFIMISGNVEVQSLAAFCGATRGLMKGTSMSQIQKLVNIYGSVNTEDVDPNERVE